MANKVDPDQTASIGAVCSGSMLFASILNSSVMQGNYLQQTTSADDIFRCIFLGALRIKLRNSKCCSVSSLRFREYASNQQRLIRLRICAGWSEPRLVAHTTLLEISCRGSFVHCDLFLNVHVSLLEGESYKRLHTTQYKINTVKAV